MIHLRLATLGILLFYGLLGPTTQQVVVDSPRPGDALQGRVVINGTSDLEGFQSYEVSFAYQQDATNTWFAIYQGKDAIKEGALATWDTTTISDGTYRIRVMVFLSDGRAVQTVVSGLRVRNYSPIETATPAPLETSAIQPTDMAADYMPQGVTPEPTGTNPARINGSELGNSLVMGGLAALGLFVLLGIYLLLRALFRRF